MENTFNAKRKALQSSLREIGTQASAMIKAMEALEAAANDASETALELQLEPIIMSVDHALKAIRSMAPVRNGLAMIANGLPAAADVLPVTEDGVRQYNEIARQTASQLGLK